MSLFDLMLMEDVELPSDASPRDRALAFHAANPAVYLELRRLAFIMLEHHKHFGIATLFEKMRWEWMVRTDDAAGFKLNNSYRATYARMLAANEPELANVFSTRTIRTERDD